VWPDPASVMSSAEEAGTVLHKLHIWSRLISILLDAFPARTLTQVTIGPCPPSRPFSHKDIAMKPRLCVTGPFRRLIHAERAIHRVQTCPGPLQISFMPCRRNATGVNLPPKRPSPAPQTKPISMFQTTLIGVSALTLAGLAYAW
jgi:hypothetical protein